MDLLVVLLCWAQAHLFGYGYSISCNSKGSGKRNDTHCQNTDVAPYFLISMGVIERLKIISTLWTFHLNRDCDDICVQCDCYTENTGTMKKLEKLRKAKYQVTTIVPISLYKNIICSTNDCLWMVELWT